MYQDFEDFLRPSLSAISMGELRGHYPRWRRRLTAQGIGAVPSPLSTDPKDARAVNALCLLVRQASEERNASAEHHLRNLVGVRPWKV